MKKSAALSHLIRFLDKWSYRDSFTKTVCQEDNNGLAFKTYQNN